MTWDHRYQKEMLRRLRSRLHRLTIPEIESLVRGLAPEIERIMAAYSHMVVDERTYPHLRLTACVLASYQALTVGPLQPDQALELVEDLFTSIGRNTLRLYPRALLAFSRDPFVAITRAGKRALEQYGSAWEFRIEETDNSFAMTATKCFYHDFFKTAAAPQLTRVFCRWDENWIGPIDPAKHHVLFERPTTMGYGGNECPFIFKRAKEGA
jgi:hypothetical protein